MLMFVCLRPGRFLLSALIAAAAAATAAAFFAAAGSFEALQAGAEEGVRLPIIMYHSVFEKQQGKYVVSPQTVESDMQYLKANGYTAVTVSDLLGYVDEGRALPEKPVMLTFDDGDYNNYTYVYPLAKKYGEKVVISPVGRYTDLFTDGADAYDADHPAYSYLTWGEISEMIDSGYVEIQNHSYDLHDSTGRLGAGKRPGESTEAYQALLEKDLRKMQDEMKEHTGYEPTAFVYPFGIVSKESVPVVKKLGFRASMNCENRINVITRDPECLYGLGRFLRPAGIASGGYFRRIGVT